MVKFNDYISILIHQTDLSLTGLIKSKLAPLNLAPEQNLIMLLLWEQDGLSQNEIAEKLSKDKTNIARMVFNLEKKGFIRRDISQTDRRSLTVFLTDEGHELGKKVIPITEEFNRTVCNGITEEELKTVREILGKMRQNAK
ncbi:MarR family winged helix-turn-helix transcriptional regulator [Bacillus sp. V5-8f]|uniref:MarR family winged helix-turn-helix transcriptional regulator n=1 Tax=Bacillus sp. V5-8f TaxID=2053044 RepID=UPI000C764D1D|nr:MarR family transcriptional regulator [Bacillus sp. V5-8f]PLT33441.1 MarR family transcriptional regulator [Bacillus sp. V5-8f]